MPSFSRNAKWKEKKELTQQRKLSRECKWSKFDQQHRKGTVKNAARQWVQWWSKFVQQWSKFVQQQAQESGMASSKGPRKESCAILQPGMETFAEILGTSSEAQKLRRFVDHAAKTDLPVLLLGETGTGKCFLRPRRCRGLTFGKTGRLGVPLQPSATRASACGYALTVRRPPAKPER
ncbi:MAG: sigma 54-interacting transcriptional regulator [Acidobacteriota bacterium]